MARDDLGYWVGFSRVSGIGATRLRALLDYFGDVATAWSAPAFSLQQAGLDRRSLANLVEAREQLDLDAELARLDRAGVHVLIWDEPGYPTNLRHVYNAPPVLYVRGSLQERDEWAVAVVGTRRASAYGKEVARFLAAGLAKAGVTVVSGLARGIDTVAHTSALEAGGRTIAVLGSGLDVIYPAENRRLAHQIVETNLDAPDCGALVSEYALSTQPEAHNFPPRNRIVSGLSLGTIVVEAGSSSGALITADFAAEQGREVFAVPGPIFARTSEGTNNLIQQGAKLVRNVADVLEELNLTMVSAQAQARTVLPENATEALLLEHLSADPVHVDALGRSASLPIAEVTSTLALMELKGMVRQVGGMSYVIAREGRVDYTVD
ncbi:MAG TPA: DNA-processing protein DprA [Anaerolineae bacterium]|jgi:DNA processing protein|nr:DNA-processing protein DprA [Anaerolineae bacterium]